MQVANELMRREKVAFWAERTRAKTCGERDGAHLRTERRIMAKHTKEEGGKEGWRTADLVCVVGCMD